MTCWTIVFFLLNYINEELYKTAQLKSSTSLTTDHPLTTPNFYLAGEDHTLTVNNENFEISWDSATFAFIAEDAAVTDDKRGERQPQIH